MRPGQNRLKVFVSFYLANMGVFKRPIVAGTVLPTEVCICIRASPSPPEKISFFIFYVWGGDKEVKLVIEGRISMGATTFSLFG